MKQGVVLAWICVGAASFYLRNRVGIFRTRKDVSDCIYFACKFPEHQELIASVAKQLKLHDKARVVAAAERSDCLFRVDEFMQRLDAFVYGTLLFYGPRMPSTQSFLFENVHSLPVGTVCVADVQYQGRGRAGNTWVSPKGCLMFSFTMQMENTRDMVFVQYVSTLAVIQGLEAVCSAKAVPLPDIKIKWPNDLYASGLKVGGVLCSSTFFEKKVFIVVGIGLNVDNKEPTTSLNALLHELDPTASSFEREELLAAILTSFEELFSLFCTQGFTSLESLYYEKWLHSGQSLTIQENTSSTRVVIEGLTPSGFLLARDENDVTYELHPDGNSLDLFQGLLKRKLAT